MIKNILHLDQINTTLTIFVIMDFKPQTQTGIHFCSSISSSYNIFGPHQPPFERVRVKVVVAISEDGLLFGVVALSEPLRLPHVWDTGLNTTTGAERGRHRGVRRGQNRGSWDTQSPWPPARYLLLSLDSSKGSSSSLSLRWLAGGGFFGGSGVGSAGGAGGSITANKQTENQRTVHHGSSANTVSISDTVTTLLLILLEFYNYNYLSL